MNVTYKNKINILIIITTIVVLCSLFFIFRNNIIKNREKFKATTLKEDVEEVVIEHNNDFIDINELYSINTDTVGLIRINETLVNYPVVKSNDNEFYLDNSFKKEKNIEGTIFMDYRNIGDFKDRNTILYGHNMSGDTMFGGLRFYREQSYRDAHPIIKIYTRSEIYEYEIFSVYVTEPNFDYRTKVFNSNLEFEAFLTRITAPSLIKSNILPKIDDKILTLSTCAFDFEDARLAVHAVLVNTKKNSN